MLVQPYLGLTYLIPHVPPSWYATFPLYKLLAVAPQEDERPKGPASFEAVLALTLAL